MRFHVLYEAFETLTAPADVARAREGVRKAVGRITASGKLEMAGNLVKRGGFFVLKDIDDPVELFALLGAEIFDHCRVEASPIISYEELGEFFRKNPVAS